MLDLSKEALKPPFGLSSVFLIGVAFLAAADAVNTMMSLSSRSYATSILIFILCIIALALLSILRKILHELRIANANSAKNSTCSSE
jgi:hypothetical protein